MALAAGDCTALSSIHGQFANDGFETNRGHSGKDGFGAMQSHEVTRNADLLNAIPDED